MRPLPTGTILPFLTLALLLATLPAAAQFRGRGDDSRDERRSEDRESRFDRGDSDRRRFDNDDDRDSRDDRRGYGRSDDDDDDRGRSDRGGYDRRRFGSSGDSDRRDRGRPSPEDFFNRIDDNGNGVIDGDEMEGRMGEYLKRAGIEEGASREDFSKGIERLRAERESRQDDDNGSNSEDSSQSRTSQGFTPTPRQRVTHDLPPEFLDRDVNGDGQIAFHEWRAWDWTQLDEFLFLDANADGFITPHEIVVMTGEPIVSESTASQLAATPANPANPPRTRQAPVTLDENNPHVQRGRQYFKALDADHDGTASVAELARLNKLRPMFERANIPLDQPMTANQFIAGYARAASQ